MTAEVKYKHSSEIHNLISSNIVVPIIAEMFKPCSVLDAGCGTGTWLKSFLDIGISDFMGIDGDYVSREQLIENISLDNYIVKDLSLPFV